MRARSSVLLLALSVMIAGVSCGGSKKHLPGQAAQEGARLEPAFAVSAQARRFLADVEDHARGSGVNLAEYEPSDTIIARYGLLRAGDDILLSGFITTADRFDPTDIHQLGGTVGGPRGALRPVTVPCRRLQDFLHVQGITYFELAETVRSQ